MVIKTKQGKNSSVRGLFNYLLHEIKKTKILEMNAFSRSDPKGLTKEFEAISSENINISRPIIHFSLSFSEHDKSITPELMTTLAVKVLRELGFTQENHQYAIVQHQEKPHKHCHVVANRVGFDGIAVDDYYIQNRAVKVVKQLEIEYGFEKVQDIAKRNRQKPKKVADPNKLLIISTIEEIFRNMKVQSLYRLAEELSKRNIQMNILKHSNTGNEYGLTFKLPNNKNVFKGSELGKDYSLKSLTNRTIPFENKIIERTIIKNLEIEI
jgi:hypothetical protein